MPALDSDSNSPASRSAATPPPVPLAPQVLAVEGPQIHVRPQESAGPSWKGWGAAPMNGFLL